MNLPMLLHRYLVLSFFLLWAAAGNAGEYAGFTGDNWYGLYLNGGKVGYFLSRVELNPDGNLRMTENGTFRLTMGGKRQDMVLRTVREFGDAGALVRIESEVTDPSGITTFEGVVTGGALRLVSHIGGRRVTQEFPAPRESVEDHFWLAELEGEPEVGDRHAFTVFEPVYQRELKGHSEITGRETRMLDGVETTVYEIETRFEELGLESLSIVAENGTLLEDSFAGGILTMRLEPEAVAKDVRYENDTIISNAAFVDHPIPDARNRDRIDLLIQGPLENAELITDSGQTILRDGDAFRFTGRRRQIEDLEPVTIPVTTGPAAEWTAPSAFVQSDDPALAAQAARILDGETGAFRASARLCEWVYDNVRSTFSARLSNALEVLENREGDCTEHTVLFVGLARAAGLPAREAAGLIYVDSPRPGFYFHQWAKVWAGEWIDVDPTFNQPIADATHIKLSEGNLTEQIRIIPLIGQLEIEVIEE